MTVSTWFEYLPVLGKLLPAETTAKLLEVGENKAEDVLETAQEIRYKKIRDTQSTMYLLVERQNASVHLTSHAFRYLAPTTSAKTRSPSGMHQT
jgi:hypothetical protein